MMNATSPARVRHDQRLISHTLGKLAFPRIVLRAAVVLLAIAAWYYVSRWLLDFGRAVHYDNAHALGTQTADLLTRINPYLWWAAVALWTLVVFFTVRGWLAGSIDAGRLRAIPSDTFAGLTTELSDETLDVLRWSWSNRDEPYTFGDLQRARAELRGGRIEKIAIVREQEALLAARASADGTAGGTVAPRGVAAAAAATAARPQPGAGGADADVASRAPARPVARSAATAPTQSAAVPSGRPGPAVSAPPNPPTHAEPHLASDAATPLPAERDAPGDPALTPRVEPRLGPPR